MHQATQTRGLAARTVAAAKLGRAERIAREALDAIESVDGVTHPQKETDPVYALADRARNLAQAVELLRTVAVESEATPPLTHTGPLGCDTFLVDDGTCWRCDQHDRQGKRPEQVEFSAGVATWSLIGLLVIAAVVAALSIF